ncbi:hypothetical protein [Kribbella sp. NPDC051137]|uniref:hypothetical protein n=1 Tax=Kribbella sp. NPDC051137 TaxID=3155045 RepID=UPI00341DD7C6
MTTYSDEYMVRMVAKILADGNNDCMTGNRVRVLFELRDFDRRRQGVIELPDEYPDGSVHDPRD